MSYINADDVLPKWLVEEVRKYVDGQMVYFPRKNENSFSWGEKSGTREKLAKRNQRIVSHYYSGKTIAELSEMYYLSEKRIRGRGDDQNDGWRRQPEIILHTNTNGSEKHQSQMC